MLNDLPHTLSAVFDRMQIPILLFCCEADDSITLSLANQAAVKCLKIESEPQVARTAEDIFEGASGITFQHKLLAAKAENSSQSFKLSMQQELYCQQLKIDLCPMLIVDECVTTICATVTDISEQISARIESNKLAYLVNEMESYMAHSAYELQEPISNLSTFSKQLKANFQDLGDGKLQLLDKVEELSNSTLALINQVLKRSRAINAVDLPRQYNFNTLCTEIFYLTDPMGHHELVADNALVNGDARIMQLTLATLFDNAVRHNPSRSLTLSTSIEYHQASNMLVVTLHDNGVGFVNPENAFLDKDKINRAPGLCLFELRQMIKTVGGAILATSPENHKGAVISFSLPGTLV